MSAANHVRGFVPWRRLLVCSVETRLDARNGLDTSVEAAGRSACATKTAAVGRAAGSSEAQG